MQSEERYTFEDFVHIVSRLRAPDGCPWDRAQTHQTLKKYLLEETQEAADAIDSEDDENFCEELGDVLLQIVLNSQLAKERNAFTIDEVIQGISEKMIRRHPWVFGDMHVDTPEEGERLWEEIKRREKQKKG
ncbi:MAG: MazG family protein [Firmicutes bacterium]|nr:MazG family protein [Bacillota bacterium]